jgi:hypothetical protein
VAGETAGAYLTRGKTAKRNPYDWAPPLARSSKLADPAGRAEQRGRPQSPAIPPVSPRCAARDQHPGVRCRRATLAKHFESKLLRMPERLGLCQAPTGGCRPHTFANGWGGAEDPWTSTDSRDLCTRQRATRVNRAGACHLARTRAYRVTKGLRPRVRHRATAMRRAETSRVVALIRRSIKLTRGGRGYPGQVEAGGSHLSCIGEVHT